jgi:hypothetical protein
MAKEDLPAKARSVVSAPVSKVTIAFPFSQVKTQEPSDALRELVLIVAELTERLAKLDPGPETESLGDRARALVVKL